MSKGFGIPVHGLKGKGGSDPMMAIMREFIEPYLETIETHSDREKLVSLASVAWNSALLPPPKSGEAIDLFLKNLPKHGIPEDDIREIIDEMVVRKLDHFAHISRVIIKMDWRGEGADFQIAIRSVAYNP
jgi:hypothetical protein